LYNQGETIELPKDHKEIVEEDGTEINGKIFNLFDSLLLNPE
jgi:hypothetical protein